jgi:hypothetical protein
LNLIVPPSKKPEIVRFSTPKSLSDFVQNTYREYLRGPGPNGASGIIFPSQYQYLSPSEVYRIVSPLYETIAKERYYWKIEDEAFKDKCHNAMIKFLQHQGGEFRELSRTVGEEGRFMEEWEGIFEMASGHVLLLECKYCVTSVLYPINLVLISI